MNGPIVLQDFRTRRIQEHFGAEPRLRHHPVLLALYRLWRDKCNGRLMPARSDFDALELVPWWGNLNIVDVERETGRFRYRVFGSNIAAYGGYELTGQYIDQFRNKAVAEELQKTYEAVVLTAEPLFREHVSSAAAGAGFLRRRLLLPLGDTQFVRTIMVGSYPIAPADAHVLRQDSHA